MVDPNVEGYVEILEPIDMQGPHSMIYAYVPKSDAPPELAFTFLQELLRTDKARSAAYSISFRKVGMQGHARWDVWHMLDDEKPPKGLAHDSSNPHGGLYSLKNMGEFKNIGHKSRIYHLREGRLIVLLTAAVGKKEDKLTADAVNPALHLRARFIREREALLTKKKARGRS